ncbi:MAG: O-antigen ligase family protein [Patescibacteria group bacterium]
MTRHRWKMAAQISLGVLVFALPWQARWMIVTGQLQGEAWEFGTMSLYATDLLWFLALVAWIGYERTQPRGMFWFPVFRRAMRALGMLAGLALLLSPWALHGDLALVRWVTWVEGIGLFAMVVSGPLNLVRISILVVMSALLQAAVGLLQFWHQATWASKWLGMAAHPVGVAGTAVVESAGERWLRIYAMMDHPNIAAAWFGLGLLLACGLMLEEGFRSRRGHGMRLWFLWGSVITIAWAWLLTFSRSSLLAFGIAFAGMLFWLLAKQRSQRVRLALLTATLRTTVQVFEAWMVQRLLRVGWVLVVIFGILFFLIPQPFFTRMQADARLERRSWVDRQMQWKEGWAILTKRPVDGVGLGNAGQAVVNYVDSDRRAWEVQPVHNVFFLVWIEFGIFGFVGWLLLWGEWITTSITSLRRPLVGSSRAGILAGMVRGVWSMTGLGILLFVFLTSQTDHFWWSLHSGVFMFFLAMGVVARSNLR